MKDLEEKQENGGEGSVSSESSFRELDDVFLQTQTRIWLGEVLHTRLDEQLHVADLLADGELLFEVSREVWEMLLRIQTELRGVKLHRYEPFACRKVSRRYLPYSNVDSFLKICTLVGLSSIDLFSPSDVVEKKDTRKVCMCIRSLSKKARSRRLNVPDFNIVTYTVSMPTTMVGCMRRSWELSRYSYSKSIGDSSDDKSSQKSKLKQHPNSALGQHCNSFSGEYSDDAESQLDTTFVDPNLEDEFSVVEDCGDGGGTPRSHVDDNLTLLSDIDPGTYASDSVMLDGKDSMFHSSASTSSSASKAIGEILETGYRYSGVDEEEVSSVSSMSSVSDVARSLDLDNHLDKDPPESQDSKSELLCMTCTEGSTFPDMVVCETDISTCANGEESLPDMKAAYSNGCADHGICMSESISYAPYEDRKVFASQPPLSMESPHQWDKKGKCGVPTLPIGLDGHDAHDEMQTNAKPFISSDDNEGGDGVLMFGKQQNEWMETASFDDKKERDNCGDSLCDTVASCILVELTPEEHTSSSVAEHSHEKKDSTHDPEHKENEKHEEVQSLAFEESDEMVNVVSPGSVKPKSKSRSSSILVSVARGAAVFGVIFSCFTSGKMREY